MTNLVYRLFIFIKLIPNYYRLFKEVNKKLVRGREHIYLNGITYALEAARVDKTDDVFRALYHIKDPEIMLGGGKSHIEPERARLTPSPLSYEDLRAALEIQLEDAEQVNTPNLPIDAVNEHIQADAKELKGVLEQIAINEASTHDKLTRLATESLLKTVKEPPLANFKEESVPGPKISLIDMKINFENKLVHEDAKIIGLELGKKKDFESVSSPVVESEPFSIMNLTTDHIDIGNTTSTVAHLGYRKSFSVYFIP